jgi:F-type H+-transporting ATPase subunit gamma
MGQRLAELQTRVGSVRQLGSVLSALRGIAASHAQQSRSRLAGVRAYADIVAGAISQALRLSGATPTAPAAARRGRTALLLFCAEQGFAGAFSDQIFDAAGESLGNATLLIVGSRGLRRAEARRLAVDWSAPMVSQVGAAAALAGRIAAALEQKIDEGRITHVEMIFGMPKAGVDIGVERRSLLPLDLRRFGAANMQLPPLINLPPQQLLERLAAEYLFAELSEAILYSFAAENTARMAAMASARDNIAQKLEDLAREERLARQDEITEEVVELAAGAEASQRRILVPAPARIQDAAVDGQEPQLS